MNLSSAIIYMLIINKNLALDHTLVVYKCTVRNKLIIFICSCS